jgi:LPS export ABC transporter permease LptG/LPS export ABC transporter permease LptF
MRRLDRYVFTEVLGPFGLGLLVYTSILWLQFLFQSAELIIRRGLPAATVGQMLLLSLPNILALSLPMAILFGVLVAVGRLSSDSEIIALRASGLSLRSLYRPLLAFGAAGAVATGAIMIWLLPWANHTLTVLRVRAVTQSAARAVEPRVFSSDQWADRVLYVFATAGDTWRGVFVADALPATDTEVIVAERGRLTVDATGERVTLHLERAETHSIDLARPDKYELSRSRESQQTLQDSLFTQEMEKAASRKSDRSMTLSELAALSRDVRATRERRDAGAVELQKKFAIPVACLVFAALGLPLGVTNRRGGRSSGFALSIGVIVVYYVLLNNGEKAARFGELSPLIAAWGPNLLFAVAAIAALIRRDRDRSLVPLPSLPSFGPRRAARPAAAKADRAAEGRRAGPGRLGFAPQFILRLPRWRPGFPNILDRYVLGSFVRNFALVAATALAIYIIADFGQNVDEVMKNNVATSVVTRYYRYLSLRILYDLAPILVLVTTLITFGLLARSNEVTAAKALGVSLFRLGVPALVGAALVSAVCAFLQAQVLPAANEKVARLRAQIRGEQLPKVVRRADRQWLFGQGKYIYNYRRYDEARQELERLQVFEFDATPRLVRRLYAERARWDGSRWVFSDGWARTFADGQVASYRRLAGPVVVDFPETPQYFQQEIRRPDEMTYGELVAYTRELRVAGQPSQELEVSLHDKIAFPAVAIVMALVALPFAFRLGKQGALYGLGLSVALGMVYLAVFSLFRTLGQAGALPPAVAVWSPSLLFSFLSAYLFLGVRS